MTLGPRAPSVYFYTCDHGPQPTEVPNATLNMHINHRRITKHRAKHHNERVWLANSLASWRREFWGRVRAKVRSTLDAGDYDALPHRYPRDIYWHYY